MDSGHSSSMQSSSGGEEEYDSRPDSIPAVGLFSQMANRQPPSHLLRHHSHSSSSFFDPPPNCNLPSNFVASSENSASSIILNRDILWPPAVAPPSTAAGGMTSDPNCATSRVGILSQFASSSSSMAAAPVQSSTQGNQPQTAPSAAAGESSQPRPRKRTRASRKAPTTVLTTDTTNFRALVQEFTGIPAAPFATPSPFSRRFDLLGSGPGGGSSLRTATANPFRPSTQKLQISPPPPPHPPSNPNSLLTATSMVENFTPTTTNNSSNILNQSTNFNSSPNFDLQLPSNNNGVGNPFFTFQSLLSSQFSPLKYLSADHQPGPGSLVASDACFSQDQQVVSDDIGFLNIRSGSDDATGLKTNDDGDNDDRSNFEDDRGLGTSKGEGTLNSWINPSS